MIIRVPTMQGAAAYDQRMVLDGVSYTLNLNWNGRVGAWYLSIYSAADEPLLLSRKLATNSPILARFRFVEGLPPGEFFAVDASNSIAYAGYDELGDGLGVKLYYFDAEEMAGL